MSEPFLAEIRIVGFNFAPRGWALCDGQILPINQNQSLYSLLGTTYGGDGRTFFALPDLRGRTPLHVVSRVHSSSVRFIVSGLPGDVLAGQSVKDASAACGITKSESSRNRSTPLSRRLIGLQPLSRLEI